MPSIISDMQARITGLHQDLAEVHAHRAEYSDQDYTSAIQGLYLDLDRAIHQLPQYATFEAALDRLTAARQALEAADHQRFGPALENLKQAEQDYMAALEAEVSRRSAQATPYGQKIRQASTYYLQAICGGIPIYFDDLIYDLHAQLCVRVPMLAFSADVERDLRDHYGLCWLY